MGSKEAKKNNRLVDQERERAAGEHTQAMGYLNPERMAAQQRGESERADIYGGYKKFAAGEGLPGGAGVSGGGGGGGGGYTPENLKLVGTLEDARNRYKGFADTGGYSQGDIQNIRAQGQAPIAGMFEGLNRRMQQGRAAGQSSNIGFGDSLQRMAREQSRAGATAARETELGIKDRQLAGQKWGLEGYTGIGGTEQDIEGRNVAERNQAAQANAAVGASSAAQAAANEKWRAGMQMDALDRMAGLYGGGGSGETARYDELLGQERGMASNQFQGSNQQRMAYNPNVSAWDRAMQIGNMAAGVGGAIMTGGASTALGAIGQGIRGAGGGGGGGYNWTPPPAGSGTVNPALYGNIRF